MELYDFASDNFNVTLSQKQLVKENELVHSSTTAGSQKETTATSVQLEKFTTTTATTVTRKKATSTFITTIEKSVPDHNHNFSDDRHSPSKNTDPATALVADHHNSSQQVASNDESANGQHHQLTTKSKTKNKVSIHERYEEYSRLSQEEKDKSKTDYTYAHSFSYSPFVPRKERYNWDIPNMSRRSVSSYNHQEFLDKQTLSNKLFSTPHNPVTQLNRSENYYNEMGTASKLTTKSTRAMRSKLNEEHLVHSTPKQTNARTGANQKSKFDFSDDDDDELQFIGQEQQQNGIKARNGYRSTANRMTASYASDDGQLSEEDEDITIIRRIKRLVRTTVLNYFTGNKKDDDESSPVDQNGSAHYYRTINRKQINRNAEYLEQVQEQQSKSRSCLLWPILFMIPILLSGCAYYLYSNNNLNNLLEDFSQSSSDKFNYFFGTFRSAPSLNNFQDLSQFSIEIQSLKNEIQSMKDRYQADPVNGGGQQGFVAPDEASSAGGGGPEGPNFDEILDRLALLELKITKCCQSNAVNLTETIESEVKQILESKLYMFRSQYDKQLENEVTKIKDNLITIVREQAANTTVTTFSNGSFDPNQIESMIQIAISKYDADKTGEADFALESSGAWVVSTRCSETYELYSASYKLLGVTLWRSRNTPRVVIQSGVVPGECWCFKGAEGRIAIHLSARVIPTAFSYEHIPKQLSRDGHINSAPSKFIVYGLKSEDDIEPETLGEYRYSIDADQPLQRFEVQNQQSALHTFRFIEMVVKSNHGHPDYTCLYRFRVHGTPVFDENN